MEIRTLGRVAVADISQVAEARRVAASAARAAGMNEAETGKVAIVTTEAAMNLVKHAGGGEVIVNALAGGQCHGLAILALDRGPGIPNIAESLRDGYSTIGTSGNGLGAMMRLASEFEIYTVPARGTAILARFWPGRAKPAPAGPVMVGGVSVPKPEEEVCGDTWTIVRDTERTRIMVADGLGHGLDAAEASTAAVAAMHENASLPLVELLEAIHLALRHTRGAVVAVASLEYRQRIVRFAGIGNIAGVIIGPEREQNMVSLSGTMGHQVRKFQDFTYVWPENSAIILHSDGISTHWNLKDYPGLQDRDPSLPAAVLYRDFRRGTDDATVIVAREPRRGMEQ